MSETRPESAVPDESLWGVAPTTEEVTTAETEMAKRAELWEQNPPVRPEHFQYHPDHPGAQILPE